MVVTPGCPRAGRVQVVRAAAAAAEIESSGSRGRRGTWGRRKLFVRGGGRERKERERPVNARVRKESGRRRAGGEKREGKRGYLKMSKGSNCSCRRWIEALKV